MNATVIDIPRALRDDKYRLEVSAEIDGYPVSALHHDAADQLEAKDARIAELEAALRPFAKVGDLFADRDLELLDHVAFYSPQIGPEYHLHSGHCVAARAALQKDWKDG